MTTLPTADDTPTPVAEPIEVQTADEIVILNWILSLPDPEEESELAGYLKYLRFKKKNEQGNDKGH